MIRRSLFSVLIVGCATGCLVARAATAPLAPFASDPHTVLLYHFDEGRGDVARDSGPAGLGAELRGAAWARGKFGGALRFDGRDDCLFRKIEPALALKQMTIECWYQQDDPAGRQFLVGGDAIFHFDLSDGLGTSLSLYNDRGGVTNAEGLRHQQVGGSLGTVRFGRWHHLAATYDGRQVSFFLDGVLKRRRPAPKDFLLAGQKLWIGCYVGRDYWFNGRIDELRLSDCVRYDPENKLAEGQHAFELPRAAQPRKEVRKSQSTGRATLQLVLGRLYGTGGVAGWVYLKPPGRRAAIVGRYELPETAGNARQTFRFDVSDELAGDGRYLVGLENDRGDAYFALIQAAIVSGDKTQATWSGEVRSRRTFKPPLLASLDVGPAPAGAPARIVLGAQDADRMSGTLDVDTEQGSLPTLTGEGLAEYWLSVPAEQCYRVYLRYSAIVPQPCDIVVDGADLNAYTMCAVNRTLGPGPRDALWEYQGTVRLTPGAHWLRLQDVLPEIVALRLEPIGTAASPCTVPWNRYTVPDDAWLAGAGTWAVERLFGVVQDARLAIDTSTKPAALRISARLANTDSRQLAAGDAVRFVRRGQWDLEPFGRLTFQFQGQGSGHVVSLWAVDVKHCERLLGRWRDRKAGLQPIELPISFEGNTVFDPGRVTAIAIELDEGNVRAEQVNSPAVAILDPRFHRRDAVQPPDGHAAAVARAQSAMAAQARNTSVEPLRAGPFRPRLQPVVPETHPAYAATEPKPVARRTLGDAMHFTGARGIGPATLDDFHKHYDFGDVCWPAIGMCPQRKLLASDADYRRALVEFERRLEEVKRRGLLLFDIWGYVPYHPDFPCTIAAEHHEILMRVFGERFLGYDNGEQDGRYIGAYAGKGRHTNRREGWDDFVRWDEHVCADGMNYMNATGSLNFSHYYGERACRMLGLETAQGLPSDTLMFAFLRGAGRQYGRLTYQATSVWNRFGYNMYTDRKTTGSGGYGLGPNKGCSRSLHQRLFVAGYLAGHSIFGTETAQFTADRLASGAPELSPLGRQHLRLKQWAERHPHRGVPYTPVALVLDFHNGWNMPRHLYRGDKYKIWGKFPYEKSDYLIDGLFRMIWPGYEDCSYLRGERGFLTPTPYGDLFDVLTNRCPASILQQYNAAMLLGDVEMTPQLVANLTAFVHRGGDLLVDARHARALPPGLTGVRFGDSAHACMARLLADGQTFTEHPYAYTRLQPQDASPLVVNEHGHPLVTLHRAGQGRVVVGAADYWMGDPLTYRTPEIVNMEPPYRLLASVQAVLAAYFDSLNPVAVEPGGLGMATCYYPDDPKRLLVGLTNNDLFADWHGTLRVRLGPLASARDLWRNADLAPGPAIALEISAGDVAILDLRLK
jgi:hypothetical protein